MARGGQSPATTAPPATDGTGFDPGVDRASRDRDRFDRGTAPLQPIHLQQARQQAARRQAAPHD